MPASGHASTGVAVPVTASDCLPLSYTAATENVYSVPLVSPVASYPVVSALTVALPFPGVQLTAYSFNPSTFLGAFHERFAFLSGAVITSPVGAAENGVPCSTRAFDFLPSSYAAATENVYSVPLVSPVAV